MNTLKLLVSVLMLVSVLLSACASATATSPAPTPIPHSVAPTAVPLTVVPTVVVSVALHRIHDHYIEKYDPQGKLLGTWAKPDTVGGQIKAGPRSGPGLVAVDANGDNYITDAGEQVHKYDKDGRFLYDISQLGSMTIDTQGNLYLFVSHDSTILKFDSHGTQIGKWSAAIPGVTAGILTISRLIKTAIFF